MIKVGTRLGDDRSWVRPWLALGGCSGTVQENLGLGKRSPDEFQVVRRAPLILPPDYSLRPPEPGAPGPAAQDTAAQAEQILTGQPRLPPAETRHRARASWRCCRADQGRRPSPASAQVLVAGGCRAGRASTTADSCSS